MQSIDTPISSRIIKTELIDWRKLKFIQDDNFKELPQDAFQRLKNSILANDFTQPFYVWLDPETGYLYCLDGKHRTLALESLAGDGHIIPDMLPATYINCSGIKEAAKLVLIYSSIYAKTTQQGLFDFIEEFDLSFAELIDEIDLPEFSEDRYMQKFNVYNLDGCEEPEVEITDDEPILVKPGDIFQLGKHRLICDSFSNRDALDLLFGDVKARILFTDPPYNLPTDFFLKDNKKHNNHENFAMGAGEMSDEEFSEFLTSIMMMAIARTVPGAIHYIFMDFRHCWHMTDAARKAYGSPIPKQVCVWNKDMMANGSFYRAKHELCFVFNEPSAVPLWNMDMLDHGGFYKNDQEMIFIFKHPDKAKHLSHLALKDRIRTNVWNYPSAISIANPDKDEIKNHPTPKPVQMVADAILDTTNPGEVVTDFFHGSGTTMIACEATGRICYAIEISPKFVQSTIKRYINYCVKRDIVPTFTHLNGNLTISDFYEQRNN
ncbi:DNA modification methylase [Pedobacter sp. BS3]|uniref:DNA modification methylase n=1 Tax=Pedobacter sp. BS3 TaxID=2567937 RepID=UPI0011EEF1D3|nr:DNA modification methylase [Pedobacter sp. BS3]TZF84528.1 DNA modification methylase [Pedobacter sp. BS3]